MIFPSLTTCFTAVLILLIDPSAQELCVFQSTMWNKHCYLWKDLCVSIRAFYYQFTKILSFRFLLFPLQTPCSHMNLACSFGLTYFSFWLIHFLWHLLDLKLPKVRGGKEYILLCLHQVCSSLSCSHWLGVLKWTLLDQHDQVVTSSTQRKGAFSMLNMTPFYEVYLHLDVGRQRSRKMVDICWNAMWYVHALWRSEHLEIRIDLL